MKSSPLEAVSEGRASNQDIGKEVREMTRVCDSCMTVAYDKGINGAAEQAATMVSIGAELSDHICDECEPDGEIRCDCGCHGQAKRRLRAEVRR